MPSLNCFFEDEFPSLSGMVEAVLTLFVKCSLMRICVYLIALINYLRHIGKREIAKSVANDNPFLL